MIKKSTHFSFLRTIIIASFIVTGLALFQSSSPVSAVGVCPGGEIVGSASTPGATDLAKCYKVKSVTNGVATYEATTSKPTVDSTTPPTGGTTQGECAGVKTSFISCKGQGAEAVGGVLKQIILIVSIGVGIVAVGGIVYGSLLYTSARDSQAQTQKAITIISSVVIGLLLYVFMTAILNWLIPGGVFS
ncbi:TPA: hypothetical protein DDX46_00225 [Candidatus Saccharibacteria bacterium]|nr:MAG: membrane protein of unknown function [Candidatus Saccharibacteria bacterium GW2011_GWC2_44_17]OGL33622.1 MAG: hypothetical protein A3E20_02615 [Candidatus Saccharibacteria bacterium RIFCSPHIGHO2_12_FULL_47_16]HBH77159.1 hypothetical protein [Candidatus Saccharibacteria bacterium]